MLVVATPLYILAGAKRRGPSTPIRAGMDNAAKLVPHDGPFLAAFTHTLIRVLGERFFLSIRRCQHLRVSPLADVVVAYQAAENSLPLEFDAGGENCRSLGFARDDKGKGGASR
jgi:hypothetical protein